MIIALGGRRRRGLSGGYYSPEEEAAMGINRQPSSPLSSALATVAQQASSLQTSAPAQTVTGDAITIQGSAAPLIPSSWWPWIIGAGLLGALWYFTSGKRGGASSEAPFVG